MRNFCYILCFLFLFSCAKDTEVFIDENPVENEEKISITTFGGSKNDVLNTVYATKDGGYITAGYTQSNNADITNKADESFNFLVLKFSSENNLEWQQNYGGSKDDSAASIIQTKDGNYVVLGSTSSSDLDVTINNGANDFWLIKIDALGNLLWQKSYGFLGADTGTKVIETNSGGLLITGVLDVSASNGQGNAKTNATKHAGGDYWAIKTDAFGNVEWSRFFGGSFTDTPLGIVETPENQYIIAGSSDSKDFNIKNNKGAYDFWIIKISNTGALIWEKNFGGSEIDEARAITTTNDGNFIVVGDTRSTDKDVQNNNGAADIWVVKFATNGTIIWQKTLGGTNFDVARAIFKTQDNGFLIAGSSRSLDNNFTNNGQNDALLLKINNSGELLWQKTVGGSQIDFLYGITELNNNTIIAVGESSSSDFEIQENKGFADALLIKFKE
ncbi:hypothetical protein [uncultured Polaribacter sp.]|uniref:hypothetical protein n=1 Tax=uncultured Polaribacter sp. TaxID=174711 RepID=UPI0034241D46